MKKTLLSKIKQAIAPKKHRQLLQKKTVLKSTYITHCTLQQSQRTHQYINNSYHPKLSITY